MAPEFIYKRNAKKREQFEQQKANQELLDRLKQQGKL